MTRIGFERVCGTIATQVDSHACFVSCVVRTTVEVLRKPARSTNNVEQNSYDRHERPDLFVKELASVENDSRFPSRIENDRLLVVNAYNFRKKSFLFHLLPCEFTPNQP
jgi:hypothetical protein